MDIANNKEQVIITIPKSRPYGSHNMGRVSFGVMIDPNDEKWHLMIYRSSRMGSDDDVFCTNIPISSIGDIVHRINEITNEPVIVTINSNKGVVKMEVYDDYRE